MRWLCVVLGLVGVVGALAPSCSVPTTQVVFVVRARGAALLNAHHLVVVVRNLEGPIPDLPSVRVLPPLVDDAVLARVPVVPRDGDESRVFDFEARLENEDGTVVLATVTMENVGFAHDQLREIPILLASECEGQADGVACGNDRECNTCQGGLCVPSSTDRQCGCAGDGDTCDGRGRCVPTYAVTDVQAASVYVNGTGETESWFRDHTCAVVVGGAVSCWGSSDDSVLGNTGTDLPGVPRQVLASDRMITRIAGGGGSHCTITSGTSMCWGDNASEILSPIRGPVSLPTARRAMPVTVREMAMGFNSMFAIDDQSRLWAWGRNAQGEVAISAGSSRDTIGPTLARPPADVFTFIHVDGDSLHNCAIRALHVGDDHGELHCWGLSMAREIDPTAGVVWTPRCIDVPGEAPCPSDWTAVSVGHFHTCAIRVDHSLWCWGGSTNGQTGLGPNAVGNNFSEPRRLPGAWSSVSAGNQTTCAIERDTAQLYCWGQGRAHDGGPDFTPIGLLGDGEGTLVSSVPRAVRSPRRGDRWRSVRVGARHACAIREDDVTLWCWGDNREHAILPDDTAEPREIYDAPVRVCPAH